MHHTITRIPQVHTIYVYTMYMYISQHKVSVNITVSANMALTCIIRIQSLIEPSQKKTKSPKNQVERIL